MDPEILKGNLSLHKQFRKKTANKFLCTFVTCRHLVMWPVWWCMFLLSPFGGEPACSDMVIFCEWHRTAMDQKSRSGEDTGLGALASPLVGYLGKVSRAPVFLSLLSLAQSWIEFEKYCDWAVPIQNQQKKRKSCKRRKFFGLKLVWTQIL